jgi:hypothetical protein
MIKKDFLNSAKKLTTSFQTFSDTKSQKGDALVQLNWIGDALGLLRAARAELPGEIRNRNHPQQVGSDGLVLNLDTFMTDTYIALMEVVSYAETLTTDDTTV